MTTTCVIQCTASDLYPTTNPHDYVVGIARDCGLFDAIVLAVPDMPESRLFESYANEWGIGVYYGHENDITRRILGAAEETDIIVRVLLKRSYMDYELVDRMIKVLKNNGADYVNLPHDFNYELAADVFTRSALERVDELLGEDESVKRFNPWYTLQTHPDFKTITYHGCVDYSPVKVGWVKRKASHLQESEYFGLADAPLSSYAPVIPYLNKGFKVLDVATGQGSGAIWMSEYTDKVVGVDIRPEYIEQAKDSANDNTEFIVSDAYEFTCNVDVITSMHTLEHLLKPSVFLNKCRENLKPDGMLFIEVPLLLPRPLGEPLWFHHHKEYTRHELETLLNDCGFYIKRRLGRNRNVYTLIGNAREAVQYHCSVSEQTIIPDWCVD